MTYYYTYILHVAGHRHIRDDQGIFISKIVRVASQVNGSYQLLLLCQLIHGSGSAVPRKSLFFCEEEK
jgi:hypothetical protein